MYFIIKLYEVRINKFNEVDIVASVAENGEQLSQFSKTIFSISFISILTSVTKLEHGGLLTYASYLKLNFYLYMSH